VRKTLNEGIDSAQHNRRRRGVVIAPAGLERLTFARHEYERREHEGRRLTHDELEAVTGLTARTLARIFEGSDPVDRRSLERAFGGFGLALRSIDFRTCPQSDVVQASRTTLPLESSAFIGRDRETADIRAGLSIGRLLTLTGPGGVGKTRIALRAAREHIAATGDRVYFFDLSLCAHPNGLTPTIALARGLQDTTDGSAEGILIRLLSATSSLLVLDNCEHLREAIASLVCDLLKHCPNLKVLATSREPLNVPGEAVHRVPPLAVPPAAGPLTVEGAREFEAIRFFEERTASLVGGFTLTRRTLTAANTICRSLDGIPLAIELACSQMRNLDIADVAQQLRGRLDVLQSQTNGGPDRQKTLRASFDWSYDLLSVEEQSLLRVLCVFSGSWSAAAATTIVRSLNLGIGSVADVLARLGSKSFITNYESDFGERYTMLQVTREHLRARMSLLERNSAFRAHAEYFTAYASCSRNSAWNLKATRYGVRCIGQSSMTMTSSWARGSQSSFGAGGWTAGCGQRPAVGLRCSAHVTRPSITSPALMSFTDVPYLRLVNAIWTPLNRT
jgi:predicted ATPase